MKMPEPPSLEEAYEALGLPQGQDEEVVAIAKLIQLNEALQSEQPRERINEVAGFICAADVITIAQTANVKEGAFERLGYDPVANAYLQANRVIAAYDSDSGRAQWEAMMRDVDVLADQTKAINEFKGRVQTRIEGLGFKVPKPVGFVLSKAFAVLDGGSKIANANRRTSTYIGVTESFSRFLQYGEDLLDAKPDAPEGTPT